MNQLRSLCNCGSACPDVSAECVLDGGDFNCPAKDLLVAALQKYFYHKEFRPGQLESILPAWHGQDVFVRMATGSGKSLCMFMLPLAVGEHAMAVIISPLNGLMEQQVKYNIQCYVL